MDAPISQEAFCDVFNTTGIFFDEPYIFCGCLKYVLCECSGPGADFDDSVIMLDIRGKHDALLRGGVNKKVLAKMFGGLDGHQRTQ